MVVVIAAVREEESALCAVQLRQKIVVVSSLYAIHSYFKVYN